MKRSGGDEIFGGDIWEFWHSREPPKCSALLGRAPFQIGNWDEQENRTRTKTKGHKNNKSQKRDREKHTKTKAKTEKHIKTKTKAEKTKLTWHCGDKDSKIPEQSWNQLRPLSLRTALQCNCLGELGKSKSKQSLMILRPWNKCLYTCVRRTQSQTFYKKGWSQL